jgi:hypothetical protein
MSALALTGISLGWEERAHNPKVALEQAEEMLTNMSMIREEDEDLVYAWP